MPPGIRPEPRVTGKGGAYCIAPANNVPDGQIVPNTARAANRRPVKQPATYSSRKNEVGVDQRDSLSSLLQESRRFDPPPELPAHANVTAGAHKEAAADRLAFWADKARRLDWEQRWDQVLDWSRAPFAKWFTGGTINASVNC